MSLWELVLIWLKRVDVQVFSNEVGTREAFNDWKLVFLPVVDGNFKWVSQNSKLIVIRTDSNPPGTLGE